MAEAFVAVGGNVGDARATVGRGIRQFCAHPGIRLIARSSDYRTAPWGVTDQADFVNACIAVDTTLVPRDLLAHALATERAFGRDRATERRWGPRPLDIDLIAYDRTTMNEPGLTLPHPRLFERAFVLAPLAEIAPDISIGDRSIAAALAGIDRTGIERLP